MAERDLTDIFSLEIAKEVDPVTREETGAEPIVALHIGGHVFAVSSPEGIAALLDKWILDLTDLSNLCKGEENHCYVDSEREIKVPPEDASEPIDPRFN